MQYTLDLHCRTMLNIIKLSFFFFGGGGEAGLPKKTTKQKSN